MIYTIYYITLCNITITTYYYSIFICIYYYSTMGMLSHVSSLQSHELQPTRLLCPWNFLGRNAGASCHFLPQGILPDPGIKPLSPALVGRFFTTSTTWEAHYSTIILCIYYSTNYAMLTIIPHYIILHILCNIIQVCWIYLGWSRLPLCPISFSLHLDVSKEPLHFPHLILFLCSLTLPVTVLFSSCRSHKLQGHLFLH